MQWRSHSKSTSPASLVAGKKPTIRISTTPLSATEWLPAPTLRIGFRLIRPIDRSVASLEPRLRWQLRLAVLAAALLTALLYFGQRFYALREPAPIDAVAVLPFENLSGDPAMRYFSDGLAEELLNSLANVPGLRVPARTPSFAFRDANLDVRELGSRLDVDRLVEGSVRRQGPRLRVAVQLFEAGSGSHRWSEVYEGDAGDLFSLQERIARNVAEASGLDRQQLGTPPAVDSEAYDWYLLGRQHIREKVSRRHFGDWVERSRSYFERAIGYTPDFAAASPWLARTRELGRLTIPCQTLATATRGIHRPQDVRRNGPAAARCRMRQHVRCSSDGS